MCSEYNHKYYQKKHKECEYAGLSDKTIKTIRELSIEQIEAISSLILLGYNGTIPVDEYTVGAWTNRMEPSKIKRELVAMLVFMSGRIADEIPLLREGTYTT